MSKSMNCSAVDWVARANILDPRSQNLINGRRAEPGGEPINKYAPRDGLLLYQFGSGTADEVDGAVAVAKRTFDDGRWSKLATPRRKDALYKLAALIEAHSEELALLECLDVGKPISEALTVDLPMVVGAIRHCAEAAGKLYGRLYGADTSTLSYQLHRPIGVVAGIVGWNFPLALAAGKVGPALAAGNSLVLKPSELTSLSTARLAELALEAGVPEGVFNVINGAANVGAALAHHPDVDLVTFTGSSETGRKILIASGQSNMKRLILECGGKAPNIVFDDGFDLDRVAEAVVGKAFYNQGEVCSASSRLLIHDRLKDRFLPLLIEKAAAWSPGDPLRSGTKYGALVSQAHRNKVLGYIESGEREGARKVYESRNSPPFENGFYLPPVIFDGVTPAQRIAQEEIFGPVLSVMSFRDEAEAIRLANSTIYGLSAILWTKDMGRAHRLTQGIRAGWIVVQATDRPTPSGAAISIGGHKQSGLGTEGGLEGLEEYMSSTAVQYLV